MEPFSAQRTGWIDDPNEALARLAADDLQPLGWITSASNGTMLCRLGDPAEELYAVHKPEAGERPLWDFPDGTLHRREVATFLVSDFLGWDVVPPTVLRDGPEGPGSVQLFVPHDPAEHYFALVEESRWHVPLARLAMFDLVTNNADRKGGHVLRRRDTDHLYGIDNGLTFHVEEKIRTVVWDIAHVPFAGAWVEDLRRLQDGLDSDGVLRAALCELLAPAEVDVLARRADLVAQLDAVPRIDPEDRHYPWPPL
ncbi:SCO1664 family protein [Euzebya rosea]|uniref:SCO1664 family protein n=1 Tax=Euzebya rosea TaxID=2052804 RepID=UPI00196B621A|nr:SCO1664 family protein [Euzebya rosea]